MVKVLGVTPLSLTNPAGSGSEQLRIVLQGYTEQPLSLGSWPADCRPESRAAPQEQRQVHQANLESPTPKKNSKGYVRSDLTVVD